MHFIHMVPLVSATATIYSLINLTIQDGGGGGGEGGGGDDVDDEENLMEEEVDNSLHIKGQMMFMAEWNLIMFLAAPILTDLTTLEKSGLYVNDLPMHDFSRDLLLASEQKSDSLKDALETEQVIKL